MTRPSVKLSVLRIVVAAGFFYAVSSLVGEKVGSGVETHQIPIAYDWPTELPNEGNRVFGLRGMSLVAPEGWAAELTETTMRLMPMEGNALRSEMTIREVQDRFRHPIPLPSNGNFQGNDAFLSIQHVQTTEMDPVSHEGRIVIERDGKLYELQFRSFRYFTGDLPEMARIYLETFRVNDVEQATAMLPL